MTGRGEPAVSTVVGELLMLSVVLVMVGALVVQSGALMPAGRAPVVTVLMNATTGEGGSVTLWHKGGDYVEITTMKVVAGGCEYSLSGPNTFRVFNARGKVANRIFDLGGWIEITGVKLKAGDTVRLSTPETVLFTGTVGP
jgi:hypothetical protein